MAVRELMFNGAAGRLEGKVRISSDPGATAVLILHPHPLHGGTMNNKVVYRMFHSFVKLDCTVMRFNFRGVGNSEGKYDGGVGEMVDASLALDKLISLAPEAQNYWVCGFSFGAWIALQIIMRRPEVSKFIVAAPPAHNYDFSFFACHAEGLVVHGTKDTLVPEDKVYELYEKLNKQHDSQIDYAPINGADHFFTGQLDQLEEVVENYISNQLNNIIQQPVVKTRRDRRRRHKEAVENQ